MREPALGAVGKAEAAARESGMIDACQLHDDRAGCGTRIASWDSDRVRSSPGSSASPTPASSPSPGAQKNRLWDLRVGPARVVRSQAPSHPRPVLRRRPYLSRGRGAARQLPPLRQREAGAARLPGRQSLLHQAPCLLRGRSAEAECEERTGFTVLPERDDELRRWLRRFG